MTRKALLSGTLEVGGALALLIAMPTVAPAQTEAVLYNFQGGTQDGAYPTGGLIADAAGSLYGTASAGGSNGTVFQLVPGAGGEWNEITLHYFVGSDGSAPKGSLVIDAHGNLYGTTWGGGAYDEGVVFELKRVSSGWRFSVIHDFNSDGLTNFDGFRPLSNLIVDRMGNLYGTTEYGGTGLCTYNGPLAPPKGIPPSGCGTVFQLTPHANGPWSEKVLYSFQGSADGGLPFAGLVFDSKGVLYGTTFEGGGGTNRNCDSYYDTGCGVVFSLSRSDGTWVEKVLYTFQGQSDGANPAAPLILDRAGNLYGTTYGLALYFNVNSTAFKLSPASNGSWTETTILAFSSDGSGTGIAPSAGLIFDGVGNLYGTTYFGSSTTSDVLSIGSAPPKVGGNGVVFKLTQAQGGSWTESVVHSFTGNPDGFGPSNGTLLLRNGALYGTTTYGGSTNFGTVFKVVP